MPWRHKKEIFHLAGEKNAQKDTLAQPWQPECTIFLNSLVLKIIFHFLIYMLSDFFIFYIVYFGNLYAPIY